MFIDNDINLNSFRTKWSTKLLFLVSWSTRRIIIPWYLSVLLRRGMKNMNPPKPQIDPFLTFVMYCQPLPITLLHVAGFIANISTRSIAAYICGKVESVHLTLEEVDMNQTFSVYCSPFDDKADTILAEAFALDNPDQVVASIEGMYFKKVRLSALKAALERKLCRPSENKPPTLHQTTLHPRHQRQ